MKTSVKKFRKKPVIIEALQLRWENWDTMREFAGVGSLVEGEPDGLFLTSDGKIAPDGEVTRIIRLKIPTLEGVMVAKESDWIVKGVQGELYPVKDEIFRKTYEEVG